MSIPIFENVSPMYWATLSLIALSGFSILWFLDALTHAQLAKADINDKELQVHRNILAVSVLMELSLVAIYWFPMEALPIFAASLLTRLAQEFIDELRFHVDRCSAYESMLHLGMWVFVYTKTIALFMWGFFGGYNGIQSLPTGYYIWASVLLLIMSYTAIKEWFRK